MWPLADPVPLSSTGVFMSTVEIVAIGFCCFLILMMAVFITCVYKMFDHIQGVCEGEIHWPETSVWTYVNCSYISTSRFCFSSYSRCHDRVSLFSMDLTEFVVYEGQTNQYNNVFSLLTPVLMTCPSLVPCPCPCQEASRPTLPPQALMSSVRYLGHWNTRQNCMYTLILHQWHTV